MSFTRVLITPSLSAWVSTNGKLDSHEFIFLNVYYRITNTNLLWIYNYILLFKLETFHNNSQCHMLWPLAFLVLSRQPRKGPNIFAFSDINAYTLEMSIPAVVPNVLCLSMRCNTHVNNGGADSNNSSKQWRKVLKRNSVNLFTFHVWLHIPPRDYNINILSPHQAPRLFTLCQIGSSQKIFYMLRPWGYFL